MAGCFLARPMKRPVGELRMRLLEGWIQLVAAANDTIASYLHNCRSDLGQSGETARVSAYRFSTWRINKEGDPGVGESVRAAFCALSRRLGAYCFAVPSGCIPAFVCPFSTLLI